MTNKEYFAHTDGNGREQTLLEHATQVAELARTFAITALGEPWGDAAYALGILHDFGKYQDAFQKYLQFPTTSEKAPHSAVGAIIAQINSPQAPLYSLLLAYCISSHHRGLYNYNDMFDRLKCSTEEKRRVEHSIKESAEEGSTLLNALYQAFQPTDDIFQDICHEDYQLLIRILFSCLVDADFLDTEAFISPERGRLREELQTNDAKEVLWEELKLKLRTHTDTLAQDNQVNRARSTFLTECRRHGQVADKGIYSLYLPTGGGKTLSSLAWALEVAKKHKASRIIYVIPYTSIITQTADIFRRVLGEQYILEHHSNIDFDNKGANITDEAYEYNKLLSENWDMPIVVTTNVQFFDSLFAHRTSRARKLHNICNSVIIFDEVQMFPTELLSPMLRTMEGLQRLCGSSLLLCTATQPIFGEEIDLSHLQYNSYKPIEQEIGDVVPYDKELFEVFRRVDYELPILDLDHDKLINRLAEHHSVLCIVNTRKDAALLAEHLAENENIKEGEVIHLSRMMCSAHLKDKIELIKKRLSSGLATKVISTQLIEAGVDLDFPIVYRAIAGLDSIIQAGGRCNREGRLPEPGKVYTFRLPGNNQQGNLTVACNATNDIIRSLKGALNPNKPELIQKYYRNYFSGVGNFDKHGIKAMLWHSSKQKKLHFDFEDASNAFKYIEEKDQVNIFVPYGNDGTEIISKILQGTLLNRKEIRKLQQLSVQLYKKDAEELLRYGRISPIHLWGKDVDPVYIFSDISAYSDLLGVVLTNHFITDNLMF